MGSGEVGFRMSLPKGCHCHSDYFELETINAQVAQVAHCLKQVPRGALLWGEGISSPLITRVSSKLGVGDGQEPSKPCGSQPSLAPIVSRGTANICLLNINYFYSLADLPGFPLRT